MKPEDLQKLVTFPKPYGKYKGRVIANLPGHYLNWLAREGFPVSVAFISTHAGYGSQLPGIPA